jgi:hypothetical protein
MFQPAGAPAAAQPPDVEALMRAKVPHYELMLYGGLALGLTACTVMLVSGIGLLKMRPWARWATVGYACYNILSTIVGFVFALLVTVPLMNEIFEEEAKKANVPPQAAGMFNMMAAMSKTMVYVQLILLAYPIVLLVAMFLPSVREAFRGRPSDDVEEDFDDEEPEPEADTPRDHDEEPGAFKESGGPP